MKIQLFSLALCAGIVAVALTAASPASAITLSEEHLKRLTSDATGVDTAKITIVRQKYVFFPGAYMWVAETPNGYKTCSTPDGHIDERVKCYSLSSEVAQMAGKF